jgi:Ohr subfamily peroxiredoxin
MNGDPIMVANLSETLYTAHVTVQGGREGTARSDDGRLDVTLTAPTETGGSGTGTNPEQLFAAGYAACFQSALSGVAQRQDIDASASRIESSVQLGRTDEGSYGLAITLRVMIPSVDESTTRELIEAAHQVCPYSHATRGNIAVTLEAVAG